MQITKEIKLLKTDLLKEKSILKEISYWSNVLNRPNGWHYDLDHIWILSQLRDLGIKPGATIVDAGAGHGLFQYILAANGYNIISLDFSKRVPLRRTKKIFNITGMGDENINYDHSYMNVINFNTKWNIFKKIKLLNIFKIPKITKGLLLFFIQRFFNPKNSKKFGIIKFLRAPFHRMPLEKDSIDAIVSISALEHADINLFDENIQEFVRVLKPGGSCLITTSFTGEPENRYHKQTEGWCFSKSFLKEKFQISTEHLDFKSIKMEFESSSTLKARLDPYYHLSKSSLFFKKNMANLPYLPIAIRILKPQ